MTDDTRGIFSSGSNATHWLGLSKGLSYEEGGPPQKTSSYVTTTGAASKIFSWFHESFHGSNSASSIDPSADGTASSSGTVAANCAFFYPKGRSRPTYQNCKWWSGCDTRLRTWKHGLCNTKRRFICAHSVPPNLPSTAGRGLPNGRPISWGVCLTCPAGQFSNRWGSEVRVSTRMRRVQRKAACEAVCVHVMQYCSVISASYPGGLCKKERTSDSLLFPRSLPLFSLAPSAAPPSLPPSLIGLHQVCRGSVDIRSWPAALLRRSLFCGPLRAHRRDQGINMSRVPQRPLSACSRSTELRWLRYDGDLRRRRIKRIYVCRRTLLPDGPATANAESRIVPVVIIVIVSRPGGCIPGEGPSNVQKRRSRAPK